MMPPRGVEFLGPPWGPPLRGDTRRFYASDQALGPPLWAPLGDETPGKTPLGARTEQK